ncbi:hypothetical protein [Dehalobacterium formicoaceticum]|uniref:Sporulation membrane protein YtrI C-terminal domain-containing protein n=1 Tax=Dehalobacterium formicoaceticum TaxID=51515 RepID=A0ABT1Y5C2_9FIRM|nr:hypothetical protein [Dehalobacterium formicoaceticum]MCR6546074.1 hypothetical protein [Dehalobacterium formicoaceticum]
MIALFFHKASLIAAFIIGVLLGAALTVVAIGHTVDDLYFKNNELSLQLETTSRELTEVKSTLSQSKDRVVTKISPKINLLSDDYTPQEIERIKLALNKEIIKQYEKMIGLPVKSLEPSILPGILNGRIITVEQKQFKILVKTMVIGEALYLEVDIEENRLPPSL